MILVIGGSYQGKLDFAKEKFDINDNQVFDCSKNDLTSEFDKNKYKVIDNFEYFIFNAEKNEQDVFTLYKNIVLSEDSIIICDDNLCGVVPIDKFYRALRETTGRLLCEISKDAASVYNVLYGIGKLIK